MSVGSNAARARTHTHTPFALTLVPFSPRAQQAAQEHQFAEMIRVMVGHEEHFSEDGLPAAMGNLRIEIGGLVAQARRNITKKYSTLFAMILTFCDM